jgi:GNAT superfamily N-acetyltransferase
MTSHGSASTRLATDTGSAVVIGPLPRSGLDRFREIDRSEEATLHYRQIGTRLIPEPVKDSIPNFFEQGPHSVGELIARWQPIVDGGGVLLGAFADGDLAGLALLGTEVAPKVRQVALLFVSRRYRGRGVATALLGAMEQLAREKDASALYVSSVPTDSAVGFYLARGFRPTEPLPELYAEEPDDIHMLLPLERSKRVARL